MSYEPTFRPDIETGPHDRSLAIGAIVNWRERDEHSLYLLSRTSRADVAAAFREYPELMSRATSGPLADIAAQIAAEEALQIMNGIA